MMILESLAVSVFCCCLLLPTANCQQDGAIYEIRAPNVRPQKDDLMLCYARRVDSPIYIVEFQPIYNVSINHHMIIYGCGDMPSGEEPDLSRVWNCGEMTDSGEDDDGDKTTPTYEKEPICAGDQPPLFVWSWARGAPPFSFPEGVSYKVGTSALRYLVLQIHYKDTTAFRPPNNAVDNAGVQLRTVSEPTRKLAGIFLLASDDGVLPPKELSFFDIACRLDEPGLDMHPFAFRVHAHGNGLVVGGYRIRDGQWTEIGRMSPQAPQTFYDIANPGMTFHDRDILAARCTMYNKESKEIKIGGTQYDEMCNYYIYYYTTNGVEPETAFCQSAGAPKDSWVDFGDEYGDINLAGMPRNVNVVPPMPAGPMAHDHDDEEDKNDGSLQMVGTYGEGGRRSHRDRRRWEDDTQEERLERVLAVL